MTEPPPQRPSRIHAQRNLPGVADTSRDPWERRDQEGEREWHAFRVHRDSSPPRTMRQTRQLLGADGLITDWTLEELNAWSMSYGWPERIAAWDREADRVRRSATLREAAEMAQRHVQHAAALQMALMMPAQKFLERFQLERAAGADPFQGFEFRELLVLTERTARLWPAVAQFERLARGMSTANVGGHDGGPVSLNVARTELEGANRQEVESYLLGFEDGSARAEAEADAAKS